jgi:hypothetical protein
MRSSAPTARSIVDELFGRDMTREIWTGNYDKVLPISIQDFDLTAVLPAVFYMFRFGQRRGKGKFLETFASQQEGSVRERRRSANVARIARHLATKSAFTGFEGEVAEAILSDMLLCFCLENVRHALGREEQVQRVAPTHYMASWIDLPEAVGHLRYVPEMIAATLANQTGEYIQRNQEEDGKKTWFAVGRGFQDNVLLKAFDAGVIPGDILGSLTSDRFDERRLVGLDQLLTVRLAQQLGAAPDKLRGAEGEKISNQRPISQKAAREFSEDMRRFVRAFAAVIPRHAFVETLESCIAVGLATIMTSAAEILFYWAESGQVIKTSDQKPASLFVDCSNGLNRQLRGIAEQSMDDFMRRIESVPVILMALRLLDRAARYDPKIKALKIPTRPDAVQWLNLLGDLLYARRPEATMMLYDLERKASQLAEKLQEDYPEDARLLSDTAQGQPVWLLAECLTHLQGRDNTQSNLVKCLDAALLIQRPNGLASKRSVARTDSDPASRKRRELRSLIFTDSVLDFLVHLHTLNGGNRAGVRSLSFRDFLRILRVRYGFCIDEAPRGMTISNELLQANRTALERRLRDLGLLVGVNDAESMKRLRPRFNPTTEAPHAVA